MFPRFPNFKILDINDKSKIDSFNANFPPFSDFNFISMFVWCTNPPPLISLLNDNLVIKLNDYITNQPFLTFLGNKRVTETAQILLDFSKRNGLPSYLKLIPETNILSDINIHKRFDIKEDRDQFDYIYSLKELDSHSGNKYAEKRNFINRFKKEYFYEDKKVDVSKNSVQQEILNLFKIWGKTRKKELEEIQQELTALKTALSICHRLKLIPIGLYVDNKLIGISINEVLHHNYAINLFEKGDISYKGVFQLLKHLAGKYLVREGCEFLNFEQDLGIEGLRKSKTSYHPLFYLKKYIIYPKLAN